MTDYTWKYLLLLSVGRETDAEDRQQIVRAAKREFTLLEGIQHPGILRALEYAEHELGPALFFEHSPDAVRLDPFSRECVIEIRADLSTELNHVRIDLSPCMKRAA